MSKLITYIPLSSVERIELRVTNCRKTLSQVKAETKAHYVLNGGMWNPDGTPCPLLKVGGAMLSGTPWRPMGYAWDKGPDIHMTSEYEGAANFIAVTALISSGEPVDKPSYGSAQGGKRGRSAIGLRDGSLALYCSSDGADAATPETLRDELAGLGWASAVMLDGGGSSQCDFGGERITASRKVHNWICVWLKQGGQKPPEQEDKPIQCLQLHGAQSGLDVVSDLVTIRTHGKGFYPTQIVCRPYIQPWANCRAPKLNAIWGSFMVQKKRSVPADRLTRERIRIGLTQEELAEKTFQSLGSIRKCEQGERLPSPEFIKNMADFFGCAPEYLTGEWNFRTANEEAQAETWAICATALHNKYNEARDAAISGSSYLMGLMGLSFDTQKQANSHYLTISLKSKDGDRFEISESEFVELLEDFAESTKDIMLDLLRCQRGNCEAKSAASGE